MGFRPPFFQQPPQTFSLPSGQAALGWVGEREGAEVALSHALDAGLSVDIDPIWEFAGVEVLAAVLGEAAAAHVDGLALGAVGGGLSTLIVGGGLLGARGHLGDFWVI